MSFNIAYAAGHCLTTAGKRLPKSLDPAQTREWVLNDLVARHFSESAKAYEGVELLRLDDPSGKAGNPVADRAKKANEWKADFLIEFHHNAGANLTSAGGIVAFCYKKNTRSEKYRDEIYAACIAAGGLRGNRSSPKKTKAYTILKKFNGDGVLMEYGFMDSKVDAPVILDENYSKLVAYATMEGIAKVAGLKKKPEKKTEMCDVKLPILVYGEKGESVKAMQSLLDSRGFPCGNGATGNFGNGTKNALIDFQNKNELPASGKCDKETWVALLGAKEV